jgi:formylmethanofuran dehydrogenase subunit E
VDNGIMAATFVNLDTSKAYRVRSRETSRDLVGKYAPGMDDKHRQQLQAYKKMPRDVLFEVAEVTVDVPFNDMPGPTRFKAECEICGVVVRDKREIYKNGKILCRICAGDTYFSRK